MKFRFTSKETICNVQRLDIKPGDKLLVTVQTGLTQDEVDRIHRGFSTLGTGVVVVTDNVRVQVVGEVDA